MKEKITAFCQTNFGKHDLDLSTCEPEQLNSQLKFRGSLGKTLLHFLVSRKDQKNKDWCFDEKLCDQAIEQGMDIESKDASGDTALSEAAYCGHAVAVQYLLKKGANSLYHRPGIHAPKVTAWHWALWGGHSECMAFLEEDLQNKIKDTSAQSVKDLHNLKSQVKSRRVHLKENLAQLLTNTVDDTRNVQFRSNQSYFIQTMNCYKSIVSEGLRDDNKTILHYLVLNDNHIQLFQWFLELYKDRDINLHAQDSEGKTALDYLIEREKWNWIPFLLNPMETDKPQDALSKLEQYFMRCEEKIFLNAHNILMPSKSVSSHDVKSGQADESETSQMDCLQVLTKDISKRRENERAMKQTITQFCQNNHGNLNLILQNCDPDLLNWQLDFPGSRGRTLLHFLVSRNDEMNKAWCFDENLCDQAIQQGMIIESKDADGDTALSEAAYCGHAVAVQYLLERGANSLYHRPGKQAPEVTAWHWALWGGHSYCMAILKEDLQKKINALGSQKDISAQSVKDLDNLRSQVESRRIHLKENLAQLLTNTVDDTRNVQFRSDQSYFRRTMDCYKSIVSKGLRDDNKTILHYLVLNDNHIQLFQWFLESYKDSDINLHAKDSQGKTALDYLIEKKKWELMPFFLHQMETSSLSSDLEKLEDHFKNCNQYPFISFIRAIYAMYQLDGDQAALMSQFVLKILKEQQSIQPNSTEVGFGYSICSSECIGLELGDMFYYGIGFKQNHAMSVEWYEKAAALGNVYAQNNLGMIYEYGRGVKRDAANSLNFYLMAAEKNYSLAEYNVGRAYEKRGGERQGKKQSYEEAKKYYTRAVEHGSDESQYKLYMLHRRGLVVNIESMKVLKYQAYVMKQEGVLRLDEKKSMIKSISTMVTGVIIRENQAEERDDKEDDKELVKLFATIIWQEENLETMKRLSWNPSFMNPFKYDESQTKQHVLSTLVCLADYPPYARYFLDAWECLEIQDIAASDIDPAINEIVTRMKATVVTKNTAQHNPEEASVPNKAKEKTAFAPGFFANFESTNSGESYELKQMTPPPR